MIDKIAMGMLILAVLAVSVVRVACWLYDIGADAGRQLEREKRDLCEKCRDLHKAVDGGR